MFNASVRWTQSFIVISWRLLCWLSEQHNGSWDLVGPNSLKNRASLGFTKLVQDNGPSHKSARMSRRLHRWGMRAVNWPAESPDINPIELIWESMKSLFTLYLVIMWSNKLILTWAIWRFRIHQFVLIYPGKKPCGQLEGWRMRFGITDVK